MEVIRFARALLPLAAIALLGAPGTAGAPVLGAAGAPWDPPPCRGPAPADTPVRGAAWYRQDAVLDASATLAAQRLSIGIVGGPARHVELPPESFASGPVRGVVLVGDDDGTRSRLRAIDPARGCATTIGVEAAVIRGAILSPDGTSAMEHRVDRATRADLGVWRRSTVGGTPTRLLPGLTPDLRHGRTFATELRWAPDGRLSVASCGELACRSRLVDPATGAVQATDGTGPVLGVANGRVVAYAICPGFPCAVVAVDPATGARDTLVTDAGPAAVAGGGTLVFEHGGHLAALDLRTRAQADVAASDGLAPVRSGSGATTGIDLPAGEVELTASDREPDPSTSRRFNAAANRIEPATEVLP